MIDYEKLKECEEICAKLDDYYFTIHFCVNRKSLKCDISYTNADDGIPILVVDIDELLQKLRKLTEHKPKYKVGDTVWFVIYALKWACIEGEVEAINTIDTKQMYYVGGYWHPETQLYPSKAELIQDQIDYWTNLQEPYTNEDTDYHAPHEIKDENGNVIMRFNAPSFAEIIGSENRDIPAKDPGTIESRSQFANHECDHKEKWWEFSESGARKQCMRCKEYLI